MNLSTFLVLLVVCGCAALAVEAFIKIKRVENQVVVVAVDIAALIRCVKIPRHFLIK